MGDWLAAARDWEEAWAEELLDSIRSISLIRERKDRWDWKGSLKGGFTVKKVHVEIEKHRINNSCQVWLPIPFYLEIIRALQGQNDGVAAGLEPTADYGQSPEKVGGPDG